MSDADRERYAKAWSRLRWLRVLAMAVFTVAAAMAFMALLWPGRPSWLWTVALLLLLGAVEAFVHWRSVRCPRCEARFVGSGGPFSVLYRCDSCGLRLGAGADPDDSNG